MKFNTRPFLIVLFIWLMTILFETAQQLFYIQRFDLGADVTFWDLFLNQTYRWMVWGISAYALVYYIKRNDFYQKYTLKDFYQHAGIILGLVIIDLLIISLIQMWMYGEVYSIQALFEDYFIFYTFQKGPIYILGFIAVSVIIHFYYSNQYLQIEVLQLEKLKQTNAELYQKLKSTSTDKESMLTIKVGNHQKIIPTKEIYWIAADDYCSRVHTQNAPSYTMRISLKALEEKLEQHFLRVHRGAIVNMKMVKGFQATPNTKLILKNEVEVNVSKSKLKLVKTFLEESSILV